jgi:hypothetical protein
VSDRVRAMVYAAVMPELHDCAHACGYALAVHGSLRRDCDVVAVPWVVWAEPPERLISALARSLSVYGDTTPHGPERKPHGRLAWTIPMGCGLALDVSVMPLGGAAVSVLRAAGEGET